VATGYPVKANGISRDFMFTGNPVGLPRDIPLAFTGYPVKANGISRKTTGMASASGIRDIPCGQDMKRGPAALESQEAVRTAPAQARTPREAAKSTAPPADRVSSFTGAVEHADAASIVFAGESSLTGAAFGASYDPASWGNPGAIQQAKVYVSVAVW
jgi:hypothetical protein